MRHEEWYPTGIEGKNVSYWELNVTSLEGMKAAGLKGVDVTGLEGMNVTALEGIHFTGL